MDIPLFDREIQISPADWHNWLNNPVTVEYMEVLRREREYWGKAQAEGGLLKGGMATIEEYAKSVGIMYGLDYGLEGVEEALRRQWAEAAERRRVAEEGEEDV